MGNDYEIRWLLLTFSFRKDDEKIRFDFSHMPANEIVRSFFTGTVTSEAQTKFSILNVYYIFITSKSNSQKLLLSQLFVDLILGPVFMIFYLFGKIYKFGNFKI